MSRTQTSNPNKQRNLGTLMLAHLEALVGGTYTLRHLGRKATRSPQRFLGSLHSGHESCISPGQIGFEGPHGQDWLGTHAQQLAHGCLMRTMTCSRKRSP